MLKEVRLTKHRALQCLLCLGGRLQLKNVFQERSAILCAIDPVKAEFVKFEVRMWRNSGKQITCMIRAMSSSENHSKACASRSDNSSIIESVCHGLV